MEEFFYSFIKNAFTFFQCVHLNVMEITAKVDVIVMKLTDACQRPVLVLKDGQELLVMKVSKIGLV